MDYKEFIQHVILSLPSGLFEALLVGTVLIALLIFGVKGVKKGWRPFCRVVLIIYVLLIFYITVLHRTHKDDIVHKFTLFWSYKAIADGKIELLTENLMNIFAFIPLGLLLGFSYYRIEWWRVLLIAMVVSGLIEALQFLLGRGFCEFDDVFHNVIGCMIGYVTFIIARRAYHNFYNKRRVI